MWVVGALISILRWGPLARSMNIFLLQPYSNIWDTFIWELCIGLGVVELVMRTKRSSTSPLTTSKQAKTRTAGGLYELVYLLLNVSPNPGPDQLTATRHLPENMDLSASKP